MNQEQKLVLAKLIRQQRWAALATVDAEGQPLAAMVAYAFNEDFSAFYIHVSQLSQHTKHMLAQPRVSFVIGQPDTGEGDRQTLPRVSINGAVEVLQRDSEAYFSAKVKYLNCLPDSEQLFGFGDFVLFQLIPESLRFVGGFAQAHSMGAKSLAECAKLGLAE